MALWLLWLLYLLSTLGWMALMDACILNDDDRMGVAPLSLLPTGRKENVLDGGLRSLT